MSGCPGQPGGSIRSDELVSLKELMRRFRWGEHTIRQLRRAGLSFVGFGREKYICGRTLLDFFARLEREQNADGGKHVTEGELQ